MKTLTVEELIRKLQKLPNEAPVKVWLPGTYISISNVWLQKDEGVVIAEGSVDEGSALGDEL